MVTELKNIFKDYKVAINDENELCKGCENDDVMDPYCYDAQVRVKELESEIKDKINELEESNISWREEISCELEQTIDNIIENRL